MPVLLNVETNTLQVKVTDSTSSGVTTALSVTTNRQIPAGASALGYKMLLWCSRPTTSNVYTGAYGTTGKLPWASGWPFTGTIPPATLYSMTPSGVLGMRQLGTKSETPDANTATISAVNLLGTPTASTLALATAGNGYYLSAKIQISAADTSIRPAIYAFPTQHNVSMPFLDIDSNDGNNRRWLEKDTWEGSAFNGKAAPGWNGALVWSDVAHAVALNTTAPYGGDSTLEHEYGSAYVPATGALNIWRDNTADGSVLPRSGSGPTPPDYQAASLHQ